MRYGIFRYNRFKKGHKLWLCPFAFCHSTEKLDSGHYSVFLYVTPLIITLLTFLSPFASPFGLLK